MKNYLHWRERMIPFEKNLKHVFENKVDMLKEGSSYLKKIIGQEKVKRDKGKNHRRYSNRRI